MIFGEKKIDVFYGKNLRRKLHSSKYLNQIFYLYDKLILKIWKGRGGTIDPVTPDHPKYALAYIPPVFVEGFTSQVMDALKLKLKSTGSRIHIIG